jgi:hypothetical protein
MGQPLITIITDAFTLIGVVADGQIPTATQQAVALRTLNDNLLTQQRNGWNLGWYNLPANTNLNNNAPLQDPDIGDVKLMLASWLAPRYGIIIQPSPDPTDLTSLSNQIRAAFQRLTKRSLRYTEADLGELSRPQGGPWGGPNWL